jgi:hypothetical protein
MGRGKNGRAGQGYPVRRDVRPVRDVRAQLDAAQDRPIVRGVHLELGDLSGAEVAPVDAVFSYFGQEFRVNPDLTETTVVDLFEKATTVELEDPREMLMAKDYVRGHLHPDDFDEFWALAASRRQSITDLMKLCWRLLELITDRPTTPPSDSADGRPDIKPNSPAGASPRDIASRFVDQFERQGRPDLASQVMIAVESHEARESVSV